MKNLKLLFACATALTAAQLMAATATVNGITWTYIVSGGKASVGGGTSSSPAVSTSTTGAITIPDTLGGYPVTSIGNGAFNGCSGLTSVTIPDSVTSIGDSAFYYCGGLTSVSIPDSVTSIGDAAFSGCSGLTSVTIPDSVTSIGHDAFYGCSDLTSVTIGNTVKSIGDYAFYCCSGLTSMTIPDSVTSIGCRAFVDCCGLTSVTIPDSVTSIGDAAFSGCSGLTSVTIGNSVTSIGEWVFYNCTNLTSVTIGNSVTSIGEAAFRVCNSLTSVHISDLAAWCGITFGSFDANPCYYAHHLYLNGTEITDLVIPYSVTSIRDRAFYGCSGLTSVTIGDSVASIGDYAFYNCTNLTPVTIPDSVMSIGVRAFYGCPAALFDTSAIPGLTLVDGWIVECETSLSDYDSFPGIRGIAEPLKADRERVSASFGEGRLVSFAIRAGDDLQINVTSDGVEFPESETTVSVRLIAKGGGETATNAVFESDIRDGVILPTMLTNIDFAANVGFIVAVSNSLVSGSLDFGLQGMPEESDIAASVGCRGLSTDQWGETYPETWTHVTAASVSGVMCVDYSCDVGQSMDADSWNSSNWNYSNDYYYNDLIWGLSAYEIGQPGEIGISMHNNEEIDWTQDGAQHHYRFDWMTFILPKDAPGFLYTPLPTIHKATTDWGESYYDIGDWGNQNWGCGMDDWWLRQWQYYPLRYYHSWPSANEGEGDTCYYLDNAGLEVPPYIKAHWVSVSAGSHLAVGYFKNWDDIDMSGSSYFYDYGDSVSFTVDDGMRYWQDSPLEYDVFSWYGFIYIDNGNGVDEYYGDVSLKGIYIPESQIDSFFGNSAGYYAEGRACIVAADGYYVAEIRRTPYWQGGQTESDINDEFVKFDPLGNVIRSSGAPAFSPITEDTYYTVFAAPIPYNIIFVDEFNAANTNATTYTVEDCYEFTPPAEVEGWEFLGWDVSGVDHQTGDITVMAQWRPISYNITFVDEFSAVNTNATTYTIEDCYDFAPPAEVEGWNFIGWDVTGVTNITGDITVTAQWQPIPYNITFVDELGAANTNETTYTVEDCYDFAPPAEVEGWDFLGWDVSGVDHQTGDITVTAQWRRSNRQVTFDVGAHGSRTGGGELSQTVAWGEAAVPPEIEADIDWVFAGWDTDISRVTESMTVTALYERPPLPFAKAAGYGGAWTSGGDAEWFTEWTEEAHDGTNHLHSGTIGDGQVSWVETQG